MGDQQSGAWDREAAEFDAAADHGLHDPATRDAWRDLLLAHLPPPPARVADLGCGTGSLSVVLAEAGFDVHGVDFSPAMLHRAHEKVGRAGVDVTLTQGDAADPPLQNASFDGVLCRHVLWALPEPADVLRRWSRLLRPGGLILLIEGRWHTGAGLPAERTRQLLSALGPQPHIEILRDPALWGAPLRDERYLASIRFGGDPSEAS